MTISAITMTITYYSLTTYDCSLRLLLLLPLAWISASNVTSRHGRVQLVPYKKASPGRAHRRKHRITAILYREAGRGRSRT